MTSELETNVELSYAEQLMAWAVSTDKYISADEWHYAELKKLQTERDVAAVLCTALNNAPYRQAVSLLPTTHGTLYATAEIIEDTKGYYPIFEVFLGTTTDILEYPVVCAEELFETPLSADRYPTLGDAIDAALAQAQYYIDTMPQRFWCLPSKDHPIPQRQLSNG